jgi:predicted dehydrogenase
VVDSGEIGDVIAASAFITHTHVETRHPNPTFLFSPGGGPTLDIGPYHITQLVNCLGPVLEIAGRTRIGQKQRFMTAPNRLVDVIDVRVPTHASAVAEFASGAVATLMMSFDVWARSVPHIEIYGTRGQLRLPDPNTYDGDVTIHLHDGDWQVVPPVIPALAGPEFAQQMLRGVGVADLVASLDAGVPRANAELALHVLEVLSAIQLSSESHAVVRLETGCERPAPLGATEVTTWAELQPSTHRES